MTDFDIHDEELNAACDKWLAVFSPQEQHLLIHYFRYVDKQYDLEHKNTSPYCRTLNRRFNVNDFYKDVLGYK
jgi:hypothetical protein